MQESIDETQDYIERLFVHDVDRIPSLCQAQYQYDRLLLSAILRRLVIDGSGIAHLANRPYKMPLIVLMPEPSTGNIPLEDLLDVPPEIRRYAPDLNSHPPGFYHRPYYLNDFLKLPMAVLFGRTISARDAIDLVVNKLGGVHLEIKFTSLELYEINKHLSFAGKGGVYHIFDAVAEYIWRSLAPLKDKIVEKHGGSSRFS